MRHLTKREEQIMNILWSKGPMFVKDMLPLFPGEQLHFNTVSTIVRGLEKKGFVWHEALGATYRYYALKNKTEFGKETLFGIVSRYFKNSYMSAVSSLVEDEKISIDELKKLIDMAQGGKE